jgi:Concanavalin A-like lectin/glucanases superfamily
MSSNIQPTFVWQEGRHFDGRSQHVVVPHRPEWLLEQGVVVLDFTADRLKGAQGLLSKDAKGNLDGGHLTIWLDEGKVVVRLQDQKSEYVVQSPAKTVKKGVPTRLALAFGPGGVKLYVDGNVAGSHAYQGGLQGNQEPLVIGARDWKSSPGAADNLEAFFAGTIGALALYGRSLDAPAIAALGPAGTALAQVAGPDTGVSQPLSVEVVLEETITIEGPLPENPEIKVILTPQQPLPLSVGGTGVIHRILPEEVAAWRMFWERAKKAAASGDMDEQRAALFVELVKAAFMPRKSDEELRALDWWARIMKEKRIQAATGAQQAYADWQRGTSAPRTSRIEVMFGDDKLSAPSYEVLLASGFERVSGPATAAANQSWPKVMKRLEAAKIELQQTPGGSTDTQAIIDGVVLTLSLLKDGFTGWTTVAATAYSIASTRWEQVQEAEGLPGKLEAFLSFARATTPSLTESLYTEEGAKQAYVALIETTL